jgi:hypothetical protein
VTSRGWFYGGAVALALAEVVAPRFYTDAPHFWFENLPGWGALYGFVSCVAIIVFSKLLGRLWLTRPETYYDR